MSISDQYIDYLVGKCAESMPIIVVEKAKQCIIDFIATAANGYRHNPSFVKSYPMGGECAIIGSGLFKAAAPIAAFVNGFNAHTTELDDGHRYGMTHIGAVVVASVLAIVQERNLDFDSLIRGVVMGYEATARLAQSVQPAHKKKGFHTTGTCGTIGAALGCAFAMSQTPSQLKATLSAAATSAAGFLEIQEDSSELKPYNVSNAAMSAVMASYVGQTGKKGADDILGGNRGFIKLLCEDINMDKLVGVSDDYEIQRIYVKLYAACRHCHPAIEAAIKISEQHKVAPCDINSIRVATYQLAIKGHDHKDICGEQSAKLSIPYSVAVAYKYQSVTFDSFEAEVLNDKDVRLLIERVSVVEDADYTSQQSNKRQANVTIDFKDGSSISKMVEYAKGDRENPLSKTEFIQKFQSLTAYTSVNTNAVVKALEQSNIQELYSNL